MSFALIKRKFSPYPALKTVFKIYKNALTTSNIKLISDIPHVIILNAFVSEDE